MENNIVIKEYDFFSEMVSGFKKRTGAIVPEILKGKAAFFEEFSFWLNRESNSISTEEINSKIFPDPIQGLALPNASEILTSAFRIVGKKDLIEADLTNKMEEYGLNPEMLNQPVMTYSGGELLLLNFARASILAKIAKSLIACSPVYWLNTKAFHYWNKLVNEFKSNKKEVEVYLLKDEKYPGKESQLSGLSIQKNWAKKSSDLLSGNSKISFPEVHFPIYFPEKTIEYQLDCADNAPLISPILIHGENGIGKSTFVKKLAGILTSSGSGVSFSKDSTVRLVFQSSIKQLFGKSPEEHLKWVFQFDEEAKNKAIELYFFLKCIFLKQVSRTELDTIASAKLLLVAERLADEPEFLILDEPGWGFSFQDGINFLLTVLKTSDSMKTSVIIISHQVDVLRQICKSQINLESLGQNVVGVKVENI